MSGILGAAIGGPVGWLVIGWSAVSGGVVAAGRWAARNPAWALVLALALGSIWERHEAAHWAKVAQQRGDALEGVRKAEEAATASAIAAKTAAETRSKENADAADRYHSQLNNTRAALDSYLASHRVRSGADSGAPGDPGSAAQGGGPHIHADTPSGPVLASVADIRTCDADYAYAQSAYEWAKGLNK